MSITIGSIIIAPRGLGPLNAGRNYYFLRRCCTRFRVLFVLFSETNQARANLVVMSADGFEAALERSAPDGLLVQQANDALPPWLHVVGQSIPPSSGSALHLSHIEKRLTLIEPALARFEEILEAGDPIRALNQLAHSSQPPQNETRYRAWFLAYLIFGRPGLEPCYRRVGRWQRCEANAVRKRGRPSLSAGPGAGYNVSQDMAERIRRGFEKHVVMGDTWPRVYDKCLRIEFGVRAPLNSRGCAVMHHPMGEPFPSLNQFRYWTLKSLGIESAQAAMLGEVRARFRQRAAQGSHASSLSTLMERVETDAFYVDEYPTSTISGESLEKLCVARTRDVLSGQLTGIGFSLGRETHEAYRMALLCASMDKVTFCAFFGISIKAHQWPCVGIPHLELTDRGPGAKRSSGEIIPIVGVTPSHLPQAKPYIESSNPKSKAIDGAPVHIRSSLGPMDMIRREIRKLLIYNESADMSERATTEVRSNVDSLTPNSLWAFYSQRGRTSAHALNLDTAIRTYGVARQGRLTERGVKADLLYNAPALLSNKLLDRVVRAGPVDITVYRMPFVLGVLWADIAGELYQLHHQEPAVAGTGLTELSEAELSELQGQDKIRSSKQRTDSRAIAIHHSLEFEAETGQQWDAERVVRGRRKLSKSAKAEVAAFNKLNRRKSA